VCSGASHPEPTDNGVAAAGSIQDPVLGWGGGAAFLSFLTNKTEEVCVSILRKSFGSIVKMNPQVEIVSL
jgi:hypothetical protein